MRSLFLCVKLSAYGEEADGAEQVDLRGGNGAENGTAASDGGWYHAGCHQVIATAGFVGVNVDILAAAVMIRIHAGEDSVLGRGGGLVLRPRNHLGAGAADR